jgi:hypothetical protein
MSQIRGIPRASCHRKRNSGKVGLDVLVQSRRDKKAAKRLFRKLLKKQGRAPRVLITDKLRSYAAAKREIMPGVEHRQHKGLNNRAENSPPTDPTTRADHETVQVTATGATVSFHSRSDRQHFLPPPRPRYCHQVSSRPQPSIHHLGRGHRHGDGCIVALPPAAIQPIRAFRYSIDDKLTVPSAAVHQRWVGDRHVAGSQR